MIPFTTRLIISRAKRYLKKHQPRLITVTGSYQTLLTVRALKLVTQDRHIVRAGKRPFEIPEDLATAILGTPQVDERQHALRILTSSLLREIMADQQPEMIIAPISPRRPGQLDYLASEFSPHLSILQNTDLHTLDYFQNTQNIAHEQLAMGSRADKVILNISDEHTSQHRHHLKNISATFSNQATLTADIQLQQVRRLSPSQPTGLISQIKIDGHVHELHTPFLISPIQIQSVLAALAGAKALGIPINSALHDLKTLRPPLGYLSVENLASGGTLINTSRENTPTYLDHALKTFANLEAGRKIVIFSDIPGLAQHSIAWHQHFGQVIANCANILITIGPESRHTQSSALKHGSIDTHHFITPADAGKWVSGYLKPTDLMLAAGHSKQPLTDFLNRIQ